VKGVSGEPGNFQVQVTQHPRYVDLERCIACGLCAEKCPKKVRDEFDQGLSKRKAAYVKYPQAVPLKYAIDAKNCIYFLKNKCRACEKFCPTKAIKFDDQERDLTLNVGAVVLGTGFVPYDPTAFDTYGYNQHPNILTSLEFERMLSASGPYQGHLVRPSDNATPQKIAWLQCVGSRDVHPGAKGYCSAVCCTYAVKEAVMAMDHVPGLDTAIFYIDMRTHGKDFERYFNAARDRTGVRFVKSRISAVRAVEGSQQLRIGYLDETGRRREEDFDLVILSVGMCLPQESVDLARTLGVDLDDHGFPVTHSFTPLETSKPGIFVCGTFQSPQDIPSSVVGASGAAGQVGGILGQSRWTRTTAEETPAEMDVRGDPHKIGVFICHCGTNIAGVVDVPSVVEYARTLPHVAFATNQLFACSQDAQEELAKTIKEKGLNRIVVAACTPRTHEGIFQKTAVNAGLNKHLFEMANIRNQCSWVHSDAPDAATNKAKDLVRMAVARATQLQPLWEQDLEITPEALVIGGGLAGLTAAKTLASQGFTTHLVEKEGVLGGQARNLGFTWKGEDIQKHLSLMVQEVDSDDRIHTYLKTDIKQVEGSIGQFRTTLTTEGREQTIQHGVAVIATGANELRPEGYGYGENPRVLTGLELERRMVENDPSLEDARSVVFIQCVGSRIPERPYCSKVCCTQSVKNALSLLEANPNRNVYVLYRDLRTYGLRESIYRKAREKGVHFVRFQLEKGLTVETEGSRLKVLFTDYVLGRKMEIHPDLLVLASAVLRPDETDLARMFKVSLNEDGFYLEAHAKLRPVEFPTDGVFVCGLAHGPKPADESIAQAHAAAAKAAAVLGSPRITVGGVVTEIDTALCTGCSVCVEVCPYQAIILGENGKAEVNEALCKGCGLCAASCRSGAPSLKGYTDAGVFAQIDAA
jgi:heterodisulfide reductase subunit A